MSNHLGPVKVARGNNNLRTYRSGAHFPAPLYSSWIHGFQQSRPEVQSDYQPSSSVGGIIQLPMAAAGRFLMLRKQHDDPKKQQAIVDTVEYALKPGQRIAERIGYIPFSHVTIELSRNAIEPFKAGLTSQE